MLLPAAADSSAYIKGSTNIRDNTNIRDSTVIRDRTSSRGHNRLIVFCIQLILEGTRFIRHYDARDSLLLFS